MREVKYDEWKQIRTENAGVAIALSDGQRFIVPPMDLWPDTAGKTNDEVLAFFAGDLLEQAIAEGVTGQVLVRLVVGTDDAEETGKSEASADS